MNSYHTSVLLYESVDLLQIKPDGIYIDCTMGAGGHTQAILNKLTSKGHVYAFDQDLDAGANAINSDNLTLIQSNFRYIKQFLKLYGVTHVDGIIADLGVSSHQFDLPERGFSYRFDAPLDMRMNTRSHFKASDIIQTYSEDKLIYIFSTYGEVRNSKTLAKTIIQVRSRMSIHSTKLLNEVIEPLIIGPRQKYLAQVYQALRIEVNQELESLQQLLMDGYEVIRPGGRMAIITFHSLEDRMVKNAFKYGNIEGKMQQDMYGNIFRPWKIINKNVITPSQDEQKSNPRSSSAKLRVAEKISQS
ncbi:MAG: 16S rRNA (cytosine(1402)-N(4))-methyltransferase RsmH [Saprospiraceae bacterium]